MGSIPDWAVGLISDLSVVSIPGWAVGSISDLAVVSIPD